MARKDRFVQNGGSTITRGGKPIEEDPKDKDKGKGKGKKADLEFLQHVAGLSRVAVSQDTLDFVRWCVLKDERMSAHDVQLTLERLGLELSESGPKTSGPLREGEFVLVKADQNTNPLNVGMCEQFDRQVGLVQSVGAGTVVVSFNGVKVEFQGGDSPGKACGLYRHTPAAANADKRMIEVVYFRDPHASVSRESQAQVNRYIQQGLAVGESRYDIYYSGLAVSMKVGKDGLYFSMSSQQRTVENDLSIRAFNPQKGKVLYVGPLGKRPGGWKADLAKIEAIREVRDPSYAAGE